MELAAERHDVVRPMGESDVMEYILSKEGVLRVEPLDRRTVGRLVEAEESITRVSGGMRLENRGMMDCAGMERNFVMFCDASFPRPDEVTMEMVDDRGVVIGHDVPPCMRQDFAARDDIIWMADGPLRCTGASGLKDLLSVADHRPHAEWDVRRRVRGAGLRGDRRERP